MRHVYVSLPTALSASMRLYIAYILTSSAPDYSLLAGAFFLSLAVYSLDRAEDYSENICYPALFT